MTMVLKKWGLNGIFWWFNGIQSRNMLIFMGFIRFCCYIALENGQLVDCLLILVGGLEHILWISKYWEFHNPNWRTHIFQRGGENPPTSPTRIVYLLKLVKSHSSFKLPEGNPRKDQQTLLWKIINTSTHRDAINKDQTVGNVIFATTGKQKGGFKQFFLELVWRWD